MLVNLCLSRSQLVMLVDALSCLEDDLVSDGFNHGYAQQLKTLSELLLNLVTQIDGVDL